MDVCHWVHPCNANSLLVFQDRWSSNAPAQVALMLEVKGCMSLELWLESMKSPHGCYGIVPVDSTNVNINYYIQCGQVLLDMCIGLGRTLPAGYGEVKVGHGVAGEGYMGRLLCTMSAWFVWCPLDVDHSQSTRPNQCLTLDCGCAYIFWAANQLMACWNTNMAGEFTFEVYTHLLW